MKFYGVNLHGVWVRSLHFGDTGLLVEFHGNHEVAAQTCNKVIAKRLAAVLPGAKVVEVPQEPDEHEYD